MSWGEIIKGINSQGNIAPLDKLHGKAVFTENGTFTVPVGVSEITVSACAAGNSGGSASLYNTYAASGGYGGSAGQYVYGKKYYLAANSNLSITVGSGNTAIGNILTLLKGGGPSGSGGGVAGTTKVGNNYYTIEGVASGGVGGSTPFGIGGNGGSGSYSGAYGTPGGGGSGYGSGGGGGGGGNSSSSHGAGGAGAPGIVIIEW